MRIIKKLSLTAILLAALFTTLSILTFCIPTSAVRENVEKSAIQIEKDGLWPRPLSFYLFQIDNMTDCIMLRINATADSSRPIYAAMIDEQFECISDSLHPYNDITQSTIKIAHNGRQQGDDYSNYARYWHGYQIFLRPLLTFCTYHTIILINYLLLSLLAVITCLMIYRLSKLYAITLAICLLITNFFIVPLALQFSVCYYIAFVTIIILLTNPQIATNKDKSITLFFVVGAFTAYMDFLTTPILTLGMPLVCMTAIQTNCRNNNNMRPIANMASNSISWLAGYSLLWSAKWIIVWMLTGQNIIDSALGNAALRTGNTIIMGGKEVLMSDLIRMCVEKTPTALLVTASVIVAVLLLWAALYTYTHKQKIRQYGWLLLIAAMPIAWFAVMKNHSIQHIFFTWRDFLLTLWCIAIYSSIKKKVSNDNFRKSIHTQQ